MKGNEWARFGLACGARECATHAEEAHHLLGFVVGHRYARFRDRRLEVELTI